MDLTKFLFQLKSTKGHFKQWLDGVSTRVDMGTNGVLTIKPALYGRLIREKNQIHDLGLLSRRVITRLGVDAIVKDFNSSAGDVSTFLYHGVGTGGDGATSASTETTLVTEVTANPPLSVASTRTTGTGSNPASAADDYYYKSVALISFTGNATIKEHGLFNQAATGGGIMFDRSPHGDLAVSTTVQIEYSYTLTVTAGG